MVSFIDDHREHYGVEPICEVLPIAPSTYYEYKAQERDPGRCSLRAKCDDVLRGAILRVWVEEQQVYGVVKVWKALQKEGVIVARYTVARLMREMGLWGAVRGRAFTVTTVADESAARPTDLVNRQFTASRPNQLWVADFTHIATWTGFVYVAFVIDVFSRAIVGWRASRSRRTDLALDALEQAIHMRGKFDGLVHHSDRGKQYLSIRYTERLADEVISQRQAMSTLAQRHRSVKAFPHQAHSAVNLSVCFHSLALYCCAECTHMAAPCSLTHAGHSSRSKVRMKGISPDSTNEPSPVCFA